MLARTVPVTALVVSAALAVPAVAAAARIAVSPNPVHRGDQVRVHGLLNTCAPGDQVTLLSKAFSHRHEFAGVPAVYATVGAHHRYSVRTRIPSHRKPGRYDVTGRCGGGNLGVDVKLRVLS